MLALLKTAHCYVSKVYRKWIRRWKRRALLLSRQTRQDLLHLELKWCKPRRRIFRRVRTPSPHQRSFRMCDDERLGPEVLGVRYDALGFGYDRLSGRILIPRHLRQDPPEGTTVEEMMLCSQRPRSRSYP